MLPVEVPPAWEKTTTDPPVERMLLFESRPCKVKVMLDPELTVVDETLNSELAIEIVPGVTVTLGNADVIFTPPIVPLMVVAVPARTPVKVAV